MLYEWAARWGISREALWDLVDTLVPETSNNLNIVSESAVSRDIELEASQLGCRLFRNNRGAGKIDGSYVRFGLGNTSKEVNKLFKSSDLIGIRPVLITQAHVGRTIGQFISREVKRPGWRYKATPHELGQLNWHIVINALGGDSMFATGRGTL